jgi:hypothetical protein
MRRFYQVRDNCVASFVKKDFILEVMKFSQSMDAQPT